MVAAGGGLLVDDAACTPDWVRGALLPLLHGPGPAGARWAAAAATFGIRDADERLADLVAEAVSTLTHAGRSRS